MARNGVLFFFPEANFFKRLRKQIQIFQEKQKVLEHIQFFKGKDQIKKYVYMYYILQENMGHGFYIAIATGWPQIKL